MTSFGGHFEVTGLTSTQLKMSSLSWSFFLFFPAESIERSCTEISSGVIDEDEEEAEEEGAAPAGGTAEVADAAEGPFDFDVRVNSSF